MYPLLSRCFTYSKDIFNRTRLSIPQVSHRPLNPQQAIFSDFKRMALKLARLQCPGEPPTEHETQIATIINTTDLVRRADPSVRCNRGRNIGGLMST